MVMGFIGTNNDAIHEKLRFLQNGKWIVMYKLASNAPFIFIK